MQNVDAAYYGYMDDDDGLLIPLEKAEEEISIRKINAVRLFILFVSYIFYFLGMD